MSHISMTTASNKPGRKTASAVPVELPTTTCRSDLSVFGALQGEGTARRLSDADLAVLEPSIAAIELHTYLDLPAAFLADYRAASRSSGKHALTEAEREYLVALKKSREHSPSQREDQIKALWQRSRADKESRDRECRSGMKRWIAAVRMYELRRAELKRYRPEIAKRIVAKLVADVRRAASNDHPAENREEARRRARNIRETRTAARRNRKAFGHRGRTDGIGGEGYQGMPGRGAATPMTPGSEVDVEAMMEAEMLQMFGTWDAERVNSGVGIVQGTIEEEGDQWSVTELNRAYKRLTIEINEFLKLRRKRTI
jgi:hypothetical protein